MKKVFFFCMLLAAVPVAAFSVTDDYAIVLEADTLSMNKDKSSSDYVANSVQQVQSVRHAQKGDDTNQTADYYVNPKYYANYPSYERLVDRSNHLHGWGKFCHIYGSVGSILGMIVFVSGCSNHDSYNTTIGAASVVEGLVAFGIGNVLMKKCNETRKEIIRINTYGFPTSEIRVGDKTLVPTLNLMSDNATQEKTLGVGLSFSF